MLNYSEHGTVVDSVLYSCDASDKNSSSPKEPPVPLTLDDIVGMGHGQRAAKCRAKLELARQDLKDKHKAKLALEGALRLIVPMSAQDDAVLAEELSKSEGLMTRTGLKRVSVETAHNPSVVSIPLSKARKMEITESRKESSEQKISKQPAQKQRALNAVRSQSPVKPERTIRDYFTSAAAPSVTSLPTRLCPCDHRDRRIDSCEESLEGTAVLSHGSRLRFGCLEFVLSIAGCPGHDELITALLEQS